MSRVIIDHERMGERCEFASLQEAQQAIRDCGPEFSGVTLETRGDAVLDERGDVIGQVDCWRVGDVYFVAELFRHGRGLDYEAPPRRLQADAEQDLQECLGMMTQLERDRAAVESYVQAYRITSIEEDGTIGSAVSE